MNYLKNKTSRLFNHKYFPLLIFTFAMLIIHAKLKLGWGDDTWFFDMLNGTDKLSFVISRYNLWSSRILIEYILLALVRYSFVWRLLNTSVMLLTVFSISKLFLSSYFKKINWIIISLFLLIPFNIHSSAGWIATTLNYLWPLAFGLFSMIPIRKIICKQKIHLYEYILYIASLIFAINQEQMCVICLPVYLIFTIYLIKRDQKINWFMITQSIISIAGVMFIITCPGNYIRKLAEIGRWFPDYNNISLLRKIELGFSSSLFEFIMNRNLIFTMFCVILLLCMVISNKNKLFRSIASIPLISGLVFGIFSKFFGEIFPGILDIKNSMTPYGTGIILSSVKTWIPDLILIIVCLSVLFSLYIIFDDKKYALLNIFIILLGFGSRFLIAFSPTIWASGSRTFLPMYFSLIICSVLLYQVLLKSRLDKYIALVTSPIYIFAGISYINIPYMF